eukprot:3418737-Pyramimonas_sp.AAC.1
MGSCYNFDRAERTFTPLLFRLTQTFPSHRLTHDSDSLMTQTHSSLRLNGTRIQSSLILRHTHTHTRSSHADSLIESPTQTDVEDVSGGLLVSDCDVL